MRETTFAGLSLRITGGTDGRGGGDGPVMVLLHGFGAPGDDLVSLSQVLPPQWRYVFPAAPVELAGGFFESRAWWMIDFAAREQHLASGQPLDLSTEHPPELPTLRHQIGELINGLEHVLDTPPGPIVLGGFSQGAMLACDSALHLNLPLAGLVLMSASLLARSEWEPRMTGKAALPVFQSHGRSDAVLPFAMAETLHELLRYNGIKVTWQPFSGGHEIPRPVLSTLNGFLLTLANARE